MAVGTTCSQCGFRSASPQLFRREKVRILRRRSFCLGCTPYIATFGQKATYVVPALLLLEGTLIVATGKGMAPFYRHLRYLSLFYAAFVLAHLPTILAHELGLALAARAVGMRVLTVIIGSGPLVWVLRRRRPPLVLRRYLLGGGITIAFHPAPTPQKWHQAIFLVGGVSANLLVGAVLLTTLVRASTPQPLVILIGAALVTSQMIAVIRNAIPRRVRLGHGLFFSDGSC